jgi:D-glycero-alpha-D-manno-heptose-7-phosphate kinase
VRLDFAGGWTDVAPFATEERGMVVNAAIELRAHVAVQAEVEGYRLRSEDLDQFVAAASLDDLRPDGTLDLIKAAVRRLRIGPVQVTTRSEVPPGSGLGGSGALDVALIAALDAIRGTRRTPTELAEEAWRLEAVEAALAGGKQDQYAAALGGFNRLTFDRGAVHAEPLLLESAFLALLERCTVVCYTGQSRVSSDTIRRVMTAYARRDPRVVVALRGLADAAERMYDALQRGDLALVGTLLTENWRFQQLLDPGMRTPRMAELEAAMQAAGVLGGKAAGAGAGGCMFFVTERVEDAIRAAHAVGVQVLPCAWAREGVRLS